MARRRTDVVIAVAAALVLASCTASPSEPADAPGASQPATTDGVLAMAQPRAVHRATTLHDGRVLITGGCTARFCEDFDSGRVSELLDPASGRLAAGPEALEPRASGTATLLRDGRVLLTGGYPGEGRDPASGMEAFEPAAERFSSVGDMTTPRAVHTATPLPDGRVLLAGGYDAHGAALSSTEFFDPATGAVTRGPDLPRARAGHAAVAVGDKVVLVGGSDGETAIASIEVLENGAWREGPDLAVPRVKHGAAALPDGRVLVVGGSRLGRGTRPVAEHRDRRCRSWHGDRRPRPQRGAVQARRRRGVATRRPSRDCGRNSPERVRPRDG